MSKLTYKKFNPKKIEQKWQNIWKKKKIFVSKETNKEKKLILVEFPYPSGDGLHMGHLRGYTAGDVMARFYRLKGYNVMFPIGWDAFGLPAENYAIKTGVHPRVSTAKNCANFRKQLDSIGYSFDWSRLVDTTDPNYYRWTQWIFLQFFKKGLAYEAVGEINWCPKDKTGLANEEVIDGRCERCGTEVEKREMRQWYLKITAYAERLLKGLEKLDWPEHVKLLQKNWIGKSVGAEIDFEIKDGNARVKVFTTRADTLFGVTYLVIAPEHKLLEGSKDRITNWKQVSQYIEAAKKREEKERLEAEREKTGIELEGLKATHPATGDEIPVWVSDYVLGNYGTGAVMGVPGHDERDFGFAKKYNLEINYVVQPEDLEAREKLKDFGGPYLDEGVLVGSGEFDGMRDAEARISVAKKFGKKSVKFKMRDWVFSRQRYWGEPIPIVHCNACAAKGVKTVLDVNFLDKQVWQDILEKKKIVETRAGNPFELKRNFSKVKPGDKVGFVNKRTKTRIIAEILEVKSYASLEEQWADEEWIQFTAGSRKVKNFKLWKQKYASFEKDYLDRIGEHGLIAWKFRLLSSPVAVPINQLPVKLPNVKKYEPTGTGESPLSSIEDWVKTKCPECGSQARRETNTMPQWAGSSWYWLRYSDPVNSKMFASEDKLKYWQPVDIYFGGMEHTTLHLLYSRFWHLFLYDQKFVPNPEPYLKRVPHGIILASNGEKMSKSKGNVVNPDIFVKKFGADTTRLFELFLGPHNEAVAWKDDGIIGARRFIEKVWFKGQEVCEILETEESDTVKVLINKLIKKITEDIENYRFNTCVSAFMEFMNSVRDERLSRETFMTFLVLLYPFAPFVSEELSQLFGNKKSLQEYAWPKFDEKLISQQDIEVVIQINGKLRDRVIANPEASEKEIMNLALNLETVTSYLGNSTPKKVIFVKGRLLNIVF